MRIPTKKNCFQMMCEMKMMDHIVVHSLQVCRVAIFLADHLNRRRYHLNPDFIRAAALLHDITKTRSFNTGENHALTGGQFLVDCGYPKVGDIVRQHVVMDVYRTANTFKEVEIINYADKRVLHDKIVTLDKRLEYILERYAQKPEDRKRINLLWEKTKDLEKGIFNDLSFAPDDLIQLILPLGYSAELQEFKNQCL
ncbi:MAG: HDIG domain-containing protein [Desulfobacterales bacterium]|nr:HDIG domain-containing protein [Desulfobacterales bacterium]